MGKLRQLSPELWPLISIILFIYIELIFRGEVSCLPAALLFYFCFTDSFRNKLGSVDEIKIRFIITIFLLN